MCIRDRSDQAQKALVSYLHNPLIQQCFTLTKKDSQKGSALPGLYLSLIHI